MFNVSSTYWVQSVFDCKPCGLACESCIQCPYVMQYRYINIGKQSSVQSSRSSIQSSWYMLQLQQNVACPYLGAIALSQGPDI